MNDHCIMCLKSFGIIDECTPLKCINEKCGRQFCTQCVKHIQIYNGDNRPFQCMYCLHEYPLGQIPMEDEQLNEKLCNDTVIKYSIKRTKDLLSTECRRDELVFDIDCRRRHLKNLISTLQRLGDTTKLEEIIIEGENMSNNLSQITLGLQPNGNMILYKALYRQTISLPDVIDDVGSLYIRLCERFFIEISRAEFYSLFPNTNDKMVEWICNQGIGNDFQPKIFDLIKAVEQDLISHQSGQRLLPRTKIGFIGYTSTGKSSLLNRLLGVTSLNDDDAVPVRTIKSTYCQIQVDRKQPFTFPQDRNIQIPITFVDIQGLDKDRSTVKDDIEAGSYLDEIRKAECDIYVLVFDGQLFYEQQSWINYIEQELKRKCVLVRSKVDVCYLNKFRECVGVSFGRSTLEQRNIYDQDIIEQIRYDNKTEVGDVFLTAAGYDHANIDAEILMDTQSFDHVKLVDQLSSMAFDASDARIRLLAGQAVARVINTCFRRGYILNVLKYKIAAGFAAIIPFGDQLPRFLSRESIKEAFGINNAFLQYLIQFNLTIQNDGCLQTSVFKKYVTIETKPDSQGSVRTLGTMAAYTTAAVGSFSDDIIRVAAPATTSASRVASAALTVATLGIGIIISAGVCAWSAVSSGKHIFSYLNRICDDLILVINPLIQSIIERERKKTDG